MAIYGHAASPDQAHKCSGVKPDEEKRVVERICEALKEERIRKGISQQRLAETAGLSRTGLRHIESLQTSPTLHSLLLLAKALEVDFAPLLSSTISDPR
ncbi:MAG: XRE family transcriptional regulator [Alphaproteobacteria bacterium]|nr:MAG: XRE family transcriptional regulator [Alphaproteobacteria bacterium]